MLAAADARVLDAAAPIPGGQGVRRDASARGVPISRRPARALLRAELSRSYLVRASLEVCSWSARNFCGAAAPFWSSGLPCGPAPLVRGLLALPALAPSPPSHSAAESPRLLAEPWRRRGVGLGRSSARSTCRAAQCSAAQLGPLALCCALTRPAALAPSRCFPLCTAVCPCRADASAPLCLPAPDPCQPTVCLGLCLRCWLPTPPLPPPMACASLRARAALGAPQAPRRRGRRRPRLLATWRRCLAALPAGLAAQQ